MFLWGMLSAKNAFLQIGSQELLYKTHHLRRPGPVSVASAFYLIEFNGMPIVF